MMEKLALFKGAYYEGDTQDLRAIHPTPVVSAISCPFISLTGDQQVVFREDSFDPVTRIRRGRLYIDTRNLCPWYTGRVDHGPYNPYTARTATHQLTPDAVYDAWQPIGLDIESLSRRDVAIGKHDYTSRWRIVGAEWISIGHVLLTLRAKSLLGVVPQLSGDAVSLDGTPADATKVEKALNSLIDAFHRQQATATVDVARETARIILAEWIGHAADGRDLGDVIKKIPDVKCITKWAASIVNRFHPRGKSAEAETHASKGSALPPLAEEDADLCVNLIALVIRELGWAAE